ncbi:MAG: class I SAM-dependent methyltransferase [Clostridium sp.]|nr:class I SAM-dependent methyltransferase [Clostridium sp.]
MKINDRLKLVGDYVDKGSIPLDIGCDHAKLSIYLLKEKNFPFVYASDNKIGPLNQAKENVNYYNLADKIELIKADGLNSLNDKIDTITVTGMGGLTINKMFLENKNKLTNIKTIILSPNNFIKEVRETINKLGYYLKDEELVEESNKLYHILVFSKGNKTYSDKELYLGPILMTKNNEIIKKFYKSELTNINNLLLNNKISIDKKEKFIRIKEYLKSLNENNY